MSHARCSDCGRDLYTGDVDGDGYPETVRCDCKDPRCVVCLACLPVARTDGLERRLATLSLCPICPEDQKVYVCQNHVRDHQEEAHWPTCKGCGEKCDPGMSREVRDGWLCDLCLHEEVR